MNPLTPPKDTLATCSQAAASLTYEKTGAVELLGGFKLHLNHPSNDSWLSCMTLVNMVWTKMSCTLQVLTQTTSTNMIHDSWCFPYRLCVFPYSQQSWLDITLQEAAKGPTSNVEHIISELLIMYRKFYFLPNGEHLNMKSKMFLFVYLYPFLLVDLWQWTKII